MVAFCTLEASGGTFCDQSTLSLTSSIVLLSYEKDVGEGFEMSAVNLFIFYYLWTP